MLLNIPFVADWHKMGEQRHHCPIMAISVRMPNELTTITRMEIKS
jgi:hypothetical protein